MLRNFRENFSQIIVDGDISWGRAHLDELQCRRGDIPSLDRVAGLALCVLPSQVDLVADDRRRGDPSLTPAAGRSVAPANPELSGGVRAATSERPQPPSQREQAERLIAAGWRGDRRP